MKEILQEAVFKGQSTDKNINEYQGFEMLQFLDVICSLS